MVKCYADWCVDCGCPKDVCCKHKGFVEGQLEGAKVVDALLELANRKMDDTVDGNCLIDLMLKCGVKIKQGKDFVWERIE